MENPLLRKASWQLKPLILSEKLLMMNLKRVIILFSAQIENLAKMAEPIVSIGNQTGEGWFLTGEMLELIHAGTPNIVCIQPFGCLPNHIVGKGVIKAIRKGLSASKYCGLDYDPGASE